MQWDNGLLVAWSAANILVALYGVMVYRADAKVFSHLPSGDVRKSLPLYHLVLTGQGMARSTVFFVYAYVPPDSGSVASMWRRSLIDDLVGLPCLMLFIALLPRRLMRVVPQVARWHACLPIGVGVPAGGIVLLGELLMLASATNADIYSLQQLNTARNCAFTVMAALAFIGYGLYVHHAKRQTEEQFVSALLVTRWHTLLFCSALQLCMGVRAALANVAGSDITGASMSPLKTWLNMAYYTAAEMVPAIIFHATMRPSAETLATARRLKWAYEPLAPHCSVDGEDQDHDAGLDRIPSHGSLDNTARSTGDLSQAIDVGSLFRPSDDSEDVEDLLRAEMHIPQTQIRFGAMIGGGGSGEVHRATWQGSTVAVKIVARNMADRREFLRMQLELAQEAQLWARLRHPRVCLFLGFTVLPAHHPLTTGSVMDGSGATVPMLGLVTEYLAGGALSALLYAGNETAGKGPTQPLPWQQLLCIACDVATGMAYLHTAHVIHRDLKSHNILLCADGEETRSSAGALQRAKICDFGISKVFNRRSDMTLTGTLGTVIWTAPEVLRNEPWVAASDVYSFSIVLAEMLTRKLPYDGIHLFAVPLKVTEGYRPPLSAHGEEAQAGGKVKPASPSRRALEELVCQCWQSDPESRPTFLQIIDRLSEIGNLQCD